VALSIADLGDAAERRGGDGRCQGSRRREEQPPVHERMVAQRPAKRRALVENEKRFQ
jgi:hypothetical protein